MVKILSPNCSNCSLNGRLKVYGQIGKYKDIILIGEAPGYTEVKLGKPFVGRAGLLLKEILDSLNINKDDLCISNSVICHPVDKEGHNRRPTKEEIICCNGRLISAISKIDPKGILALGGVAYYALVVDFNIPIESVKMTDVVGNEYISRNGYKVYPTYHPAHALRNSRYKEIIKEHIAEAFRYLVRW